MTDKYLLQARMDRMQNMLDGVFAELKDPANRARWQREQAEYDRQRARHQRKQQIARETPKTPMKAR